MANNFKFLSNRIRDRIRLQLYGDFDGSSACELINVLKNYRNGSNQIFIDTNNPKRTKKKVENNFLL